MTAARQHAVSGNYLFFDVGEYRFCAPVDDVEAIVELNGIHRLPFAPKGVSGTFMFRNHLAVVCDLGDVLDVEASARKNLSVVVRLPIGLVAFRVDHVSDIVAANEVRPQTADQRTMKEWMDGYVMQGPHIAFLTTFDKLLRLFGVTSLANLHAAGEPAEPPLPERGQARVEQGAPSDAAAATPRIAASAPESVASQRADLELLSDAESAPEILAHAPEPVAQPEAEFSAAAAPDLAELRELVPHEAELGEQTPIELPPDAETATREADAEPVSDRESAPQTTGFDAESLAQPVAASDAGAVAGPAPESAEMLAELAEQEPLAAMAEPQSFDTPASPSEQAEHETGSRADAGEAIDSEAIDSESLIEAPAAEFEEPLPEGVGGVEPPAVPAYALATGRTTDAIAAAQRSHAAWHSGSAVDADEPAPPARAAESYRGAPAQESRPIDIRKRRAAIAVVAVFLLLAMFGGWWFFSGTSGDRATEARQVAAIPASQQTVTRPISPPPAELEIVGKDFELRVEPAAPANGKSPQPAPVPASRNEIVHVVVQGDTLWDIAAKHLGDPYRYPELARNSAIRNPNLIHPGDVVRIRKRR